MLKYIFLFFQLVVGDTITSVQIPSKEFHNGKSVLISVQTPEGILPVTVHPPQEYCLPPVYDDDVRNYNMSLLQWGLNIIDMQDIISEGDSTRMSHCLRRCMPFFFSSSSRSHYFKMCYDYLMKTEVLLPERLAARVKVGSFVNVEGKKGRNKPADMQQELTIKKTKGAIKSLGANKTPKAIERATAAAPVLSDAVDYFEDMLDIHTGKRKHTHKDRAPDVQELVQRLQDLNPFTLSPGRRLRSYMGIPDSPFHRLDKYAMYQCVVRLINRHKRGLAVDAEEDE